MWPDYWWVFPTACLGLIALQFIPYIIIYVRKRIR